jgi:hypothetical protein
MKKKAKKTTMTLRLATVNRALRQLDPTAELVRGDGCELERVFAERAAG